MEEKLQDKVTFIEKNMERSYEELSKFKEVTNDIYQKQENDQHEMVRVTI